MKKNESDDTKSEIETAATEGDIERKRLLVRVAGDVAVGLLVSPSPKVDNSEKIATVAIDIAEAILRKAGL